MCGHSVYKTSVFMFVSVGGFFSIFLNETRVEFQLLFSNEKLNSRVFITNSTRGIFCYQIAVGGGESKIFVVVDVGRCVEKVFIHIYN